VCTWSEGTYSAGSSYGLVEVDGGTHTVTLTIKNASGTTVVGPLVVAAA
jgi:hypothetical protein